MRSLEDRITFDEEEDSVTGWGV